MSTERWHDDRILIVAGTHAEAAYGADRFGLKPKDWIFVGDANALIGRRHQKIAFLGEWWNSPVCRNREPVEICAERSLIDVSSDVRWS